MATTKIKLYNAALRHLGERKLASLTEDRGPRYILDDVWDNDVVDYCLSKAAWGFATRAQRIDPSSTVTPPFGYKYAYEKPSDYLRTVAVCYDAYYNNPVTAYADEAGYWFSDAEELYVKFVSNDTAYGGNYSLWSKEFADYVGLRIAFEIGPRVTTNRTLVADMELRQRKAQFDAESSNGQGKPTQFLPKGSWAKARHSSGTGIWSRGED